MRFICPIVPHKEKPVRHVQEICYGCQIFLFANFSGLNATQVIALERWRGVINHRVQLKPSKTHKSFSRWQGIWTPSLTETWWSSQKCLYTDYFMVRPPLTYLHLFTCLGLAFSSLAELCTDTALGMPFLFLPSLVFTRTIGEWLNFMWLYGNLYPLLCSHAFML